MGARLTATVLSIVRPERRVDTGVLRDKLRPVETIATAVFLHGLKGNTCRLLATKLA